MRHQFQRCLSTQIQLIKNIYGESHTNQLEKKKTNSTQTESDTNTNM